MEREIWEDVAGFEGLYKVSNTGRIISLPQENGRCGRKRGNELKTRIGRAGYVYVSLREPAGPSQHMFFHRILATAFIPNPENKPTVNHKNSIRNDNRIENLEWATWSENNKHAYKFGKQNKFYGERHSQAKLNWQKVNEIRNKHVKNVYGIGSLAKEYGVSKGCIQAILERITWNKPQTIE